DLDMMSYSFHDNFAPREWSEQDRRVLFTPDFMRRGWVLPPPQIPEANPPPEELYFRAHPFRAKFPQARPMKASTPLAERIRAQETAGHLVFGSRVQAKSQ